MTFLYGLILGALLSVLARVLPEDMNILYVLWVGAFLGGLTTALYYAK